MKCSLFRISLVERYHLCGHHIPQILQLVALGYAFHGKAQLLAIDGLRRRMLRAGQAARGEIAVQLGIYFALVTLVQLLIFLDFELCRLSSFLGGGGLTLARVQRIVVDAKVRLLRVDSVQGAQLLEEPIKTLDGIDAKAQHIAAGRLSRLDDQRRAILGLAYAQLEVLQYERCRSVKC